MLSFAFSLRRLFALGAMVPVLALAACSNSTSGSPASTESTGAGLSTESSAASSSAASVSKGAKGVAETQETFGSLAPAELFEQFESCMPAGMADSAACSGEKVGQFQFFESAAKAASTTQLLTELRSSRIVEDKGDRIVGWSTLGTNAVITVVDNKRGLVLQQMVSSDKQDPEKLIYQLGLAEQPETESSTAAVEDPATTESEEPQKS